MNNSPVPINRIPSRKGLYRIGALAALLALAVFRRNFGVEFTTFNGFGIFDVPAAAPTTALDWFSLFGTDKFVALALFDLFDLINYALVGLIFLAIYIVLRKSNPIAMGTALGFGLIGITVYFASNQTFAMLNLSERYLHTAAETNQVYLLSAGEALLAMHNPGVMHQGTGIQASLCMVLLAGLVISVVMLRAPIFSKAAGYAGILANGFNLLYFAVIPLAPNFAWLPPTISAPFRITWYFLIALKLYKLSSKDNNNGK